MIDPIASFGLATSFTDDLLMRRFAAGATSVLSADFNQVHSTLIHPRDLLGDAIARLVVLWRIEDVFEADLLALRSGDTAAVGRIVDGGREIVQLAAAAAADHGVSVVLGLPPLPVGFGIDLMDPTWSVPLSDVVHEIRSFAGDQAASIPGLRLLDHGAIVQQFSQASAHDHRNQLLYRQPYTSRFTAVLAAEVVRAVRSFDTPTPKAIVLDADNTLWSGIVGEDGVAGVEIGGAFPGSAFRHFQAGLRSLRSQGVLLAVASKNNPGAVEEVFRTRPEMVLEETDIAAWRVGWGPKSESIKSIAEQFNIGLDSIVFIDDSPFEISEVETHVPAVRCLTVPEEVEELPDMLGASGLFRMIQTSEEDLRRTAMVQTEARRRESAAGLDQAKFLESLDLRVTLHRNDPETLHRVTQLINKTNQFNLTTVRRAEAEVAHMIASDHFTVYAGAVEDRFGSYGLVVVAILDWSGETPEIETLLMSCRVLKRGIESAVLAAMAVDAAERGASRLAGSYVPTAKNEQVANLYAEHGFEDVGNGRFELVDLSSIEIPPHVTVFDA